MYLNKWLTKIKKKRKKKEGELGFSVIISREKKLAMVFFFG